MSAELDRLIACALRPIGALVVAIALVEVACGLGYGLGRLCWSRAARQTLLLPVTILVMGTLVMALLAEALAQWAAAKLGRLFDWLHDTACFRADQ